MSKQICIRLPNDVVERLHQIAEVERRTFSQAVVLAIEDGLAHRPPLAHARSAFVDRLASSSVVHRPSS